ALGLGAAANVFVGMTEAPLLIRPYLAGLSRSALFALMTCGMATVAGTVMVLYAGILADTVPDAMGHILTASLISAPAALMIAGILAPEHADEADRAIVAVPSESRSSMDAITRGTLDAIPLWLNILAMLIVMIALVSLANQILGLLPALAGEPLTAQRILGWAMAPVVWLIGIPWSEAQVAGSLMGVKTILNELIAYIELAGTPSAELSDRSRLIMTYALCGFANLGSLGIMIGGLGAMAPERRDEIVALGLKSILAGTMATLMTGAVVALIL
ncbi:MAG: nucleoside transporter C-terminal domain-containing protein, partial [Thiocapsa sp. C3-sup]